MKIYFIIGKGHNFYDASFIKTSLNFQQYEKLSNNITLKYHKTTNMSLKVHTISNCLENLSIQYMNE